MKIFILLIFAMFQLGCSTTPEQEVYPTNLNDCEPITDNEDYINIDCKKRSVNRLMDDVRYINEPALVTLQAYSMMNSSIDVCSNLTTEDIRIINKKLELIYNEIGELYNFKENPEFKKEIELINEKLKGKYDSKIREKDCKELKQIADDYKN